MDQRAMFSKWVPAHGDIGGNEHAEKSLRDPKPHKIVSTFHSLRHFTTMIFKYNFQLEAVEISKDKSWAILNENPSLVPEAPR
ncbi:UNVERIFIED_CONTAM: hypothetical protein NCL1_35602 [Trichonephila clavipes]